MPHLVKLCVLGSTGVGKTSLVEQLIDNQFSRQHRPTNPSGDSHHFSLIMNSNLIHVKIIDMPMISYFPTNTYYEWTDYRQCALRSANGYLLVFDLTSPGSFHYIKVIRDQLFESRNMQNIPVWIIANKADLCMNVLANMRGHREHHHHHHHHPHHHHHYHLHHHSTHEDLTPAFKDLANLVKKQWKSSYIECSAKYNWRVTPIFRDIIKTIENTIINDCSSNQPHHQSHHHRDHHKDHHKDHKDHSDHSDSIKVSTSTATHTHTGHTVHTGTGAVQINLNLNNPTSNENARTCVIL